MPRKEVLQTEAMAGAKAQWCADTTPHFSTTQSDHSYGLGLPTLTFPSKQPNKEA